MIVTFAMEIKTLIRKIAVVLKNWVSGELKIKFI